MLDYRDKRPIYEQMVEKLERLIVNGGLEPLTKMPSVRSLAMELSVNPNTVQRAYAQLEQDGYLYTVSGRGSFVTAESEWREGKQGKVLRQWSEVTLQAREAGVAEEKLVSELRRIYQVDPRDPGRSPEAAGSADGTGLAADGARRADSHGTGRVGEEEGGR